MFKRYLITGATGFLGRTVITQLLEKNATVFALVLDGDPLRLNLPQGVHVVTGDVCDEHSLIPFFSNADSDTCVIHCAGIVSVASKPGNKIYQVNVEGTKNILNACIEHKVGKLIHISSVHAIPEQPKGIEITEDAIFSPDLVRGDYSKSKAIATALVFDAAKNGLNVCVLFPSGIIGPGDLGAGSVSSMLTSFISGKLPFAVKGGYDFVDVRDVASGIIACSEHGVGGQGYILSGHFTTVRELLELAKEALNLKRNPIYLPIIFAKLVAPIYEKLSSPKKRPVFFTPYAIEVLTSNGTFSRKLAFESFNYQPRPLKSTIHDTALWLQEKLNVKKG